ncbi:MAG: hypothetical protein GW763_06850 [Paraglaciecola sp.]|nr:hypothetical protein [Paraglaciecola sp.]NCT47699.1 hypothetical protein [Paraglaciecola sp.]
MSILNPAVFLNAYAQSLNNQDAVQAASFFMLPTVIMSDHLRRVVNEQEKLEQLLGTFIGKLKAGGISQFKPMINQTMRLSDTLLFTNIRWQLCDENGLSCISCAASYTMQEMPNEQLKIIIAVIDDDKKQLEHIFPVSQGLL